MIDSAALYTDHRATQVSLVMRRIPVLETNRGIPSVRIDSKCNFPQGTVFIALLHTILLSTY